jgi:uncharacterized protein with von Willebrand factor type A (vWA) domain
VNRDAVLPRLHGFVEALRKSGVRAATADELDCVRALAMVDAFASREHLRALLSCTLAKSVAEEETLARVFDLTFGFALPGAPAFLSLEDLLAQRGIAADRAEDLARALEGELDDALVAALLAGDDERVTELLREALEDTDLDGLQSPLQVQYFTGRVLARLGADALDRLSRTVRMRAGAERDDALSDEDLRALEGALADDESALRRLARRAVEVELEKRTAARAQRSRNLLDRDLATLSPKELEEMRALVRQLAHKLKARMVRHRKRTRRGRLDVRHTLRASTATDGVPMRVRLVHKRPKRPDLVVLCDVSDSVRRASVFMLELVAALGDVMQRMKAFVFVDKLVDVTPLLRAPPGVLTSEILEGRAVNLSANSDYGTTLRALWAGHRGEMSRRTTLVILGDGRTNYRPPEDALLADLKRRVRRVLWLSPEERGTWGFGDSEMLRYSRHADAISGLRSARDLAAAIDRLVRPA